MNQQSRSDRDRYRSETEDEEVFEEISLDGAADDPERFPELEDSPLGFVQAEIDRSDHQDEPGGEHNPDTMTVGVDPELVMDGMREFSSDDEILADFAERQGAGNSERLLDELREHTAQSPGASGEDVDADWQRTDQVGEEAVGGTVATPDQDVVEELGEALGLTYNDAEPLHTEDKLAQRDLQRWELNPASAESEEDEEDVDLYDRAAELQELGLLDAEDLAELDEDELEALVDELDDNIIDDDDDLDDEIDDMDNDFLLGGLDEEP